MATCDSEVVVYEEDTALKPKRQDAWKCYDTGGYVEFVDVYDNSHGKIRYKLPKSLVAKYLEVTEGYTYETTRTTDYIFTLECTVVFYGFQSKAIKVQTCIEPIATPTPTPTTGAIACATTPTGATVIHNGYTYWKKTNCVLPDVPIGQHRIEFQKTGYYSEVFVFQLYAGEVKAISATLRPLPTPSPTPINTGNISCISNPDGANVILNGNTYWKPTNCLVPDLPTGSYEVKYTKTGYLDYKKTIYLSAGETEIVSATLIKESTPVPKGNISCITNPTGATVRLNGTTYWEKTNCIAKDLTPGNYRVDYILAGYMDYTKNIYLSAGETETVSAVLIKLEDQGSISCTSTPTGATITLDGANPHTTPYTYTKLEENKYYTVKYTKSGYNSVTQHILVKGASSSHANLILVPSIGFDINVNIPGLTTYQNKKLWVEPVTKIPLTNTWIPSGVYGGIQWEKVSNRTYLARDTIGGCDPQPNKYFTGSTNKLESNTYYAVFVGDVILETFPAHLVHKTGSTSTVNVSVTDDHYDWLMNKTCDLLDISETECKSTLEMGILDVLLSAEDISIVLTGKSIYPPYDQKTPTLWNYLFAGLTFIPIGGTVKGIGKIGTKLTGGIKHGGSDLENFVRFNTWKSARFPEKDITFLEVMWELQGRHLDLVVDKLYDGDLAGAHSLILKHLPDGVNPNDCAKDLGKFTKELFDRLPTGVPAVLIKDAGLEKSFNMAVNNIAYAKNKPTKESINTLKDTFYKVPATRDALKSDVEKLIKESEPTPEELERFSNINRNLKDDIPEIIDEVAKETPPTTMKRYIDRVYTWCKAHPRYAMAGGMAIWFMIDNFPFYVYLYLVSKGANPGSRSYQGKDHIDVIDTYYWNTKEAEEDQNWTLFCENLIKWEEEVNKFEVFIETYKSTLQNEASYNLYKSKIEGYRLGLQLKYKVHPCGLPSEFTATIEKCTDADSIDIKYEGNTIECRLLGINSPENKGYIYSCSGNQEDFLVRRLTAYDKECIEETTWHVDQAMYDSTVDTIKMLLPVNTSVTIKLDKNNEKDKYGRVLVVVYRGGTCINTALLKAGIATVFFYSHNSRVNTTTFLQEEAYASSRKYGIWQFAEGTGSIQCTSENQTACNIWLDGGDTGHKTVSNVFTLTNVIVGTHEVVFSKMVSGVLHLCTVSNVVVSKNQTAQASCSLKAPGPSPTPTCPNATASYVMSPSSPKEGDTIIVDGSDSSGGTGHNISKYEWSLDQVVIGTGVTHSFTASVGNHILSLKVTNDCGDIDTKSKSFNVDTSACPNATASYIMTPSSPKEGDTIEVNASDSSGGSGHWITNYEWILDQVSIGTGLFHSFTAPLGNHILSLKVTNDCGDTDSKTKSFDVSSASCPSPTASFINSPTSPAINQYMHADASDSTGDATADIVAYEWYVDDILVNTGVSANFIFTKTGTITLKLKVVNSCGGSDTKTKFITVSDPTPPPCPNPTASYVMSPKSPNVGDNVTVNGSDSKGGTGHSISSYEWILNGSGIGYGVTASFTAKQGNHILTLRVKNDCGNLDTISKSFSIGTTSCPNPSASYVMAPTSPKVNDDVLLDASASSGGSGSSISDYNWFINNILIGTGKEQSFTARPGVYILKLEVINICGNSDFASKSFTVQEPTPVPGPTGTIYCKSQNETACEIWLDNQYTGHKTVSNVYLLKDIPVGPHTVVFKKMKSGVQYMCSVSLTVTENNQSQAECWLTKEILFAISFESYPAGATITKQ